MKTIRTTKLSLMLALIALSASVGFGQAVTPGQTTKGAVIKGKAPVNKEVLKVKLPKAEEATLPNGLRVVLLRSTKVPTFTMQMVVLSGGGLADKDDFHGLATFTTALLREGTTKRSSKDIAEQVDGLGATFTATAGLSSLTSTVSMSGLVENLDQTLDIFADLVRNPSFPQAEVDKYKARTLDGLRFQRSNPNFLAQEQFS